jgi:hypothetical protein
MPKYEFTTTLNINLDRLLTECSDNEIIELSFLLDVEFRRRKIKPYDPSEEIKDNKQLTD